MKNNKQAVIGAILGGAIGDAIGHNTEFNKSKFMTDLPENNRFTDDSQMSLGIAEAILSVGVDNIDRLMLEMARNWGRWASNKEIERWGANDRAPGGTCMGGVHALDGGKHWMLSGATSYGKGNGGPMRSGYIGACLWKTPVKAFQIGGLSSIPTHNNIEAILASAAQSFMVASSIGGATWNNTVGAMLEMVGSFQDTLVVVPDIGDGDFPSWVVGRFASAYAFGKTDMSSKEFDRFNHQGFTKGITRYSDFKAVEAVAAAIFHNTRSKRYRDCVLDLANYTGDSDTTACIGGCIAGARWPSFVPTVWRERVEKSPYLHNLAERVWLYSTTGELQPYEKL